MTAADIDVVRQAAEAVRRLPQPEDQPADEAARTEFFREMVGAATPSQELEAQLRAREWARARMLQPRRGCRHHIPCHRDGMDIHVRPYRSADEDKVLALSIRAWSSVFASMEQVLGREIFVRLHGEDWQTYQEKSVREVLADPAMQVVVADGERGLAGFVAATLLDPDRGLGEVTMLAVDPDAHEQGIGTVLTQHATAWLRDNGMRVAMIGTGGDPGHAPARRTYEKAGYTLIPMARYFKAL